MDCQELDTSPRPLHYLWSALIIKSSKMLVKGLWLVLLPVGSSIISVVSFPFHNNDDLLWHTICQARKLSVHPACICATYTVCTWSGIDFTKVLWAHNWNIICILCAVIDSYHPIKSQICTAVVTFAKLLWRDWIIILQVSSKIFFKIWIMNSSSHYEMDSRMLGLGDLAIMHPGNTIVNSIALYNKCYFNIIY